MRDYIKIEIPQPDQVSIREKEDAMGAYLMMFASLAAGLPFPGINLIAAIIYYTLNKQKSKFVKFHSIQSLYSQIPVSIFNTILVSWTIYNIGFENSFDMYYWSSFVCMLIVNIFYFIYSIIAAINARKGRLYYFIIFGEYAFEKAFLDSDDKTEFINKPPTI